MSQVRVNFPQPQPPKAGEPLVADTSRGNLDYLCGIHQWWTNPRSGGTAVANPLLNGTPYISVEDLGSVTVDFQYVEGRRGNSSVHSHVHLTLDGSTDDETATLWGGVAREENGFHAWGFTDGVNPLDAEGLDGNPAQPQGLPLNWFEVVLLQLPDNGSYADWSNKTSSMMERWGLTTASLWGHYGPTDSNFETAQILPPDSPQNNATNFTWTLYPIKMGAWLGASTDAFHLPEAWQLTQREIVEEGRETTEHSAYSYTPENITTGWFDGLWKGNDEGRAYVWYRANAWVAPRPVDGIPPDPPPPIDQNLLLEDGEPLLFEDEDFIELE
jgi:hypothetical protein